MVLLSVPTAALRYDFTIAGGASGGINSAIHVWVEQRKAADSTEAPPATKYAVLLDAGGPAAIRDRKGQNILHTCVRRHGPSLIAAGANVRSKMVSDPPASIFQFRETRNHPSRA